MKEQIEALKKLQELVLIRDEHNKAGDGSHLEELDDSVVAVRDTLCPQAAGVFSRLYKKSHVFIAAMSNGCCSVCGMQVPTAQAQQVRHAQHLVSCSSCGRILFAAEADAPRNVAEEPDRDNPKTGIARFSDVKLVCADLGDADREKAISMLAERMESGGYVTNAGFIVSAALEREAILSTAMEGGFAFPHVRGVEGGRLVLALGVSKKGIDWDGSKVNIVFLSAIPVAASDFYIRLVSGLVQAFTKRDNIAFALEAADDAALWKLLSKATKTTVK